MTGHTVYPGGPACNPNCPGESSMYHDGYADGYEHAEAATPTVEQQVTCMVCGQECPDCGWLVAHPGKTLQDRPTVEQSGPLDVDVLAALAALASWPFAWTSETVHIARWVAAEYARLVPQPARPADTALREALVDMVRATASEELPMRDWWTKVLRPARERAQAALAEQPTSSEPTYRVIERLDRPGNRADGRQPTSSEQDWGNGTVAQEAIRMPDVERLHEALTNIDTRGCGGTHQMGYGFCQQLAAEYDRLGDLDVVAITHSSFEDET